MNKDKSEQKKWSKNKKRQRDKNKNGKARM